MMADDYSYAFIWDGGHLGNLMDDIGPRKTNERQKSEKRVIMADEYRNGMQPDDNRSKLFLKQTKNKLQQE